ncbi:D-2-hydroxyacid dehydrogenase family protein [Rhizobium tumorigenes]|uniref:D-2-hydroxyacid dehydrogenase family protein n=1 Tax=Rhizobium tumorigenes TaxID=2041385 RepID=A0AAF1KFA8_9HYPH|nr:D-2-hydroxyacid dehydrogenase family protein [Rhizobium tumorigenes]WFR98971.1 D-2-hydroxyacid dehydrogenase family protein [Rhizobium tumorigenes]
MKIAVLDDYQNVALTLADWSDVTRRAEVTVFNDHLADRQKLVQRLAPFDVICVMRERTPMPAELLAQLPNLKLIVSTGARNASIDVASAAERGIVVKHTGYASTATVEMTWALILGVARHVASENASLRSGGWQRSIGSDLNGRTLGLLGLGNVGSRVATIAHAFGMKTIAWSQNLTAEKAEQFGTTLVSKEALFRQSDFLSVHLVLSDRSRGLVGAGEIALMKPTAFLINSSRGPIVTEAALIDALRRDAIAGAAVDVFDVEPMLPDHPFRTLPNMLATPHIGYVSQSLYETFYRDTVSHISEWLTAKAG